MRKLMNGHRGAGRPVVIKVLAVDFVVAGKVVHVDQETGHVDQVVQATAHAVQNVGNVVDNRAGLLADIQGKRPRGTALPSTTFAVVFAIDRRNSIA